MTSGDNRLLLHIESMFNVFQLTGRIELLVGTRIHESVWNGDLNMEVATINIGRIGNVGILVYLTA